MIVSLCSDCGGFYQAGVFQHAVGCLRGRHESIHSTCDALVEDGVPPDVLTPIRAYADSMLPRASHSHPAPEVRDA